MLASIFAALDERTKIPIRVDDLIEIFRIHSAQDEVHLFGAADLDAKMVRGFIRQFTYPSGVYGEPVFCTHIVYSLNQPVEWRRLTIAKELVHMADNARSTPNRRDELANLLDAMADPLELSALDKETAHSINDKMAVVPALALLLPRMARRELRHHTRSGKMSMKAASDIVHVPELYTALALSDRFEAAIDHVYCRPRDA